MTSSSEWRASEISSGAPHVGHANWQGGLGDQGAQVQQGGENNFQGRYIIRHYWEGPVACGHPVYGMWGGPPGQSRPEGQPGSVEAGQDLASAPRGAVRLPAVITSGLPAFGIAPKKRALRKGEKPQP